MEQQRKARDYMTREMVVLRPSMGLHQALELLLERDVSGAPVADEQGGLVGIFTEKDGFRAAYQASYHRQLTGLVADAMVKEVEVLDADMGIVEVVETFHRSPYRRFPVLKGQRLVGMLSRRDVLRAVVELW